MRRRFILFLMAAMAAGCNAESGEPGTRISAVTDLAACQPGDVCEVVIGTRVTARPPVTITEPLPTSVPEVPCTVAASGAKCSPDRDGDGVPDAQDCMPDDPTISPHAAEIRCDDIDQNCDGFDDCDSDGDGLIDRADCDPNDPLITNQCRAPGPAVD